jgi:hypothetical protein
MKRMAMVLIVLFTAASLFAGGHACDMKAHAAKAVELDGTLVPGSDGTHPAVFRVANSDQSYNVCEKTKSSILKLSGNVHIKGKVATCSEGHGEELMIESAKKI